MSSTERSREPFSVHDFLPRVYSFLVFIPLKAGSIIIGGLSVVYCVWHIDLLMNRTYNDNVNADSIKSLWKTIMILSDVTLGILGAVLVYSIIMKELNLARLWLLAALQNGMLLMAFECVASPIFYQDKTSRAAFAQWPYTYYYSAIAFVILYCMYVVNSFIVTIPKPRSYPTCEIPMTE